MRVELNLAVSDIFGLREVCSAGLTHVRTDRYAWENSNIDIAHSVAAQNYSQKLKSSNFWPYCVKSIWQMVI